MTEKSVDRPRNHNLRDSGAIEERADMIFLLWWERKMKLESLSRFDGDNTGKNRYWYNKSKDGATGRKSWNVYPEYHQWVQQSEDKDKYGIPIEPILYEKAVEKSNKMRVKGYNDNE